jgi:CHAD domain-containing protein
MPTKNTGLEHVLASLQVQLEALRDHEAGARGGRDPEDLHKMRMAVRRLRAILRASRPLFEAKWVKGLRSELDWLGTVLGEARDLDVLRGSLGSEIASLGGAERTAGQRLLRRLEADRARARGALRRVLDSPRYARLLNRLKGALAAPRVVPADDDASLLGNTAAEFKKLRRAVKALAPHPDADDLHEIRIKVKRARYAAELVRAAAGGPGDRFIDQAKTVQDILGEHQDAVILEEYLHNVRDGREATHALEGELLRRQRKRRKKSRTAFFEAWPKLERRGRKVWSAVPMP